MRLAFGVHGFRDFVLGGGLALGGQNSLEWPDAKESLAAGIAAVSRESQQTLGEEKGTFLHSFARNAVQVEVPALRAMRQVEIVQRHAPRVKADFASFAAPGTAACQGKEKISEAGAVRTETFRAAALRTNHR
jgi:hypothetical protein